MRHKIVLLAILAASPIAAAEPALAPGAWSHQTTMISAENTGYPQWLVKMFGNTKRKSCHTAADLTAHPEALLTQDDDAVCKPRRYSAQGGKLIFDTFCTNKRFPDGLLIASKGTYTADSYSISTISTGMKNGAAVKIVTSGTGQRTAPSCSK